MKQDIATRADIDFVVRLFYDKVKVDEVLGPIFMRQIEDWEPHLLKIISFWDQVVFLVRGQYYGSPIDAHVHVDAKENYAITPEHFGKWLFYWINTINEHFEGSNAEVMKNQARKMQTALYLKMFEHKPKSHSNT